MRRLVGIWFLVGFVAGAAVVATLARFETMRQEILQERARYKIWEIHGNAKD